MTELIKLGIIFLLIVLLLKFTQSLPLAIGLASVAVVLLFSLDIVTSLKIAGKSVISPITITTVLAFYFITFLQRMLEKKGKLNRAQESLDKIFNNRRINASLAPMVIGMLPAAGVVTIAGAMVDKATENYLDVDEKTFISTYYRHVGESFLPTFPSVSIGSELAGIPLATCLVGMIPIVILIICLGFVFYLRKVPKSTGSISGENKIKETFVFFQNLWPLFLIVALVLFFKIPVYLPVVGVAIAGIFIDHITWTELKPMFISAFERKLLLSTVFIMIFKDILVEANAITILPEMFGRLPLPSYIIYALIVFFGTIISGQQAINVVVFPMVFTAGSKQDLPLFLLLMTAGYCGMQVSPTHICLIIIIDYFKVSFGNLVKKTIPVIVLLLVLACMYYLLLKYGFML
jgi:integral membrane protein (TIGR00529 family)